MLKHGKFSILGICLLTFSLITGNLIPSMQAQAAPRSCAPLNSANPPLADLNQRQGALAELQKIRSTALVTGTVSGLGPSLGNLPVTDNTSFSGIRAQNHATYLANIPNDFGKAYEVNPGNGCFTNLGNEGAKIAARFATTNSTTDAIQQAMASVYMRLPLLEPHLSTIGIGFDTIFTVIDDASPENYNATGGGAAFTGYIIGYPGPNVASPISTTFLAGEGITNTGLTVPARTQGGVQPDGSILGIGGDPISGGTTPTTNAGFPISVVFDKIQYSPSPSITKYSLVETSGTITTPTILKPPSDINAVFSPLMGANTPVAAVLIPVNPLKPNTDYTVTFSFVGGAGAPAPNGKTITWTFKTADVQITPTPGTGTASAATATPNDGSIPGYTPIVLPTSGAQTPTPTAGLPGAPGIPPGGGPTSFYTPTPGNGANPNRFFQVWRRVDDPVKNSLVNRSWLYGPLPYGFSILYENYEGGRRIVAYHDKARMELTNPASGYVSNGLLVREMISGGLQLGDNIFDIRTAAANQSIAGDPYELNPSVPSYAVLAGVASLNNDKRSPNRSNNQQVVETMDRNGSVGTNFGTAGYGAVYVYYDYNLGHNIPNKFWTFMNQGGLVGSEGGYYYDQIFDWVSVMGLPLSEPYWVKAYVGGQQKDVLVQVFERRVLTYTPSNSPAFQVEMGNVGRAYYKWRYGREP